jgi:hypothetical protein
MSVATLFWIPTGGPLQGAVVFHESFAIGNSGNTTVGAAGWNGYTGPAATDLTTTANQGDGGQNRVGIGYISSTQREYLFSANGAIAGRQFALTSSGTSFSSLLTLGSLEVGDIASISWRQGNSATVPEVRLMVQINGSGWYASSQTFANSGTYTGSAFFTSNSPDLGKSLAFSTAASAWLQVSLVPGTELALGAAPAADLDGLVTGIGFYAVHGATGQTVRLDDLVIEAVPEPSACVAILGGFGAFVLLGRARMRRGTA